MRMHRALIAAAVALTWHGAAAAQDAPMPPYVRISMRRLDSLAANTSIRKSSGAENGIQLLSWAGSPPLGRLDDSTLLQFAALMRDTFRGISDGACRAAAVDWGPSFPVRELDSTLSVRYADLMTAQVMARVREQPVREEAAPDSALLRAQQPPVKPSWAQTKTLRG